MSTLSEILLKPGQGQNDRFYDYDFQLLPQDPITY